MTTDLERAILDVLRTAEFESAAPSTLTSHLVARGFDVEVADVESAAESLRRTGRLEWANEFTGSYRLAETSARD